MGELPAKEVYELISCFETKSEFKEFARGYLGLKNYQINDICDNYSNSREQKYQMISFWKSKIGQDATIQRLRNLISKFQQDRNGDDNDERETFSRVPVPSENDEAPPCENRTCQRSLEEINPHPENPFQVPNDQVRTNPLTREGGRNPEPATETLTELTDGIVSQNKISDPGVRGDNDGFIQGNVRGPNLQHSGSTEASYATYVPLVSKFSKPQNSIAQQSRVERNADEEYQSGEYHPDNKAWGTSSVAGKIEIDKTFSHRLDAMTIRDSPCDLVINIDVKRCTERYARRMLHRDDIYKICNSPKGFVVILNNNFLDDKHFRIGANRDVDNMKKLWKGLDCKVVIKEDLSSADVMEYIKRISKSEQLKKFDFFVMFIMSHGRKHPKTQEEVFKCSDNKYIHVDTVLEMFDNPKSPNLIGKPKLFFFQFCRGSNIDYGFPSDDITNDPKEQDFSDIEVVQSDYDGASQPCRSDMLISYPTQSGFRSYRSEHGSWFINAIAHIFAKYAKEEHVTDMMIRVRKAVKEKYGRTVEKKKEVPCKSMSESRDLLSKKLYLFPGYPEDELS